MSTDRIRTSILLPVLTAILSAPALVAQEPDPARKPDPAAVEYYSQGLQLLRNRDFPNAAIAMEQAVNADSTYGDAHYALAKTYKVLDQFDRAREAADPDPPIQIHQAAAWEPRGAGARDPLRGRNEGCGAAGPSFHLRLRETQKIQDRDTPGERLRAALHEAELL